MKYYTILIWFSHIKAPLSGTYYSPSPDSALQSALNHPVFLKNSDKLAKVEIFPQE